MTYNLRLNWNPEGGDDYNIPCGIVRVTTSWHLNAIDLVYAVSQPKERSTAADTLRRLIKKKLFDESDITYVVHSQYKKIGIVSFAKAIKLLMVLGGKTARVEREKFARGLHLFYAGDAELKAEIDSTRCPRCVPAALFGPGGKGGCGAKLSPSIDHRLM